LQRRSLQRIFDYLANGLSLVKNNVRLKILYLLFEEKTLRLWYKRYSWNEHFCYFSLAQMKIETIRNWWEAQTIFTHSLNTKNYPFFEILDKNKIVDAIWKVKKINRCRFAHRNYSFTMLYYTYFGSNKGTVELPNIFFDRTFLDLIDWQFWFLVLLGIN
jgi:hypothetical protein